MGPPSSKGVLPRLLRLINYSFLFKKAEYISFDAKRLLCMFAHNKYSKHPNELYTKRKEILDWLDKTHPDIIDLYGMGWDTAFESKTIMKLIGGTGIKRCFFKNMYHFYKGTVPQKLPVLMKYRFNVCLENVKDIPGYITEKIFDCFFAGCVPIYLGANNIDKYVPAECFIDMRKYSDYGNLFSYINDMEKEEYEKYIENIKSFLSSENAHQFSAEYFSETIVNTLSNLM